MKKKNSISERKEKNNTKKRRNAPVKRCISKVWIVQNRVRKQISLVLAELFPGRCVVVLVWSLVFFFLLLLSLIYLINLSVSSQYWSRTLTFVRVAKLGISSAKHLQSLMTFFIKCHCFRKSLTHSLNNIFAN